MKVMTWFAVPALTALVLFNCQGGPDPVTVPDGQVPRRPAETAEAASGEEPAEDLLLFSEDFEAGLAARPWGGDVSVITASDPLIREDVRPWFGNGSRFVRFRAGGEKAALELPVRVPRDACLSFFYRTDIDGKYGQRFRVLIDGKEAKSLGGLDRVWRQESVPLNKGDHRIRFELDDGGFLIEGHDNAVYLDRLTVAADAARHITVDPPGVRETWTGAPSEERLVFVPRVRRIDGSVMPLDAGDVEFLVTGEDGTCFGDGIIDMIDGEGVLTPLTPGTYRIRAALKTAPEIYGLSGAVIVHDRNFLDEPYLYPGTGVTYRGYRGGKTGEPLSRRSITVKFPLEEEFSADAFFTLRGAVDNPACLDHGLMTVSKLEDGKAAPDRYYLCGPFDIRVWLRHGPGKYRVDFFHIEEIDIARYPGPDGFVYGATYEGKAGISFTVVNTRGEDGGLIYPGPGIEADDFRITNLVNEIRGSASGEIEKIQSIHDRIIMIMNYRERVPDDRQWKAKSDALLALKFRSGVCEEYTLLGAALLRAAGIPAEVVFNSAMKHAYCLVSLGGVPRLFDLTFDDPFPGNADEYRVTYKYFLKEPHQDGVVD